MKKFAIVILYVLIIGQGTFSQTVGIGTTSPHASAQLDISSTNRGLLIPRMNSASINAISNPAKGLLVYDSTLNQLLVNTGMPALPNWQPVASGGSWNLAGNAGIHPNNHFIGTLDNTPLKFRMKNRLSGFVDSSLQQTFFGFRAGNSPGEFANTAIGYKSLSAVTTGIENTALGAQTLTANTTGSKNVAIGTNTLLSNTTGIFNAGTGFESLTSNLDGSFNTAMGTWSLFSNTSGSYNAAHGYAAMEDNTTGFYNAAVGGFALSNNTTGYYNTAVGYASTYNNTTGLSNTAVGTNSLFNNETGRDNVAIGLEALYFNNGNHNVAVGKESLHHNENGEYNTGLGYGALYRNTTGSSNASVGAFALAENTTGFHNTAVGVGALRYSTTGTQNAAIGLNALYSNTTGTKNTASGWSALYSNTTGYYNAALGDGALMYNSVGTGNTAVGSGALYNTTTSSYNTAIGFHAGFLNNMGWNNTLIGAETNITVNGVFNSIALGNGVHVGGNNVARIGNSATMSIGGYQNWSNYSDGRYKKNIREDVSGLDFIMKLRPVTYQLDILPLSKKTGEPSSFITDEKMQKAMNEKESLIQSGFIAQEVEQAARDVNYNFSGIDKPKSEADLYALRYAEFVVPLVKAMQEQQKIIEKQQSQIDELKKQIQTFETNLNKTLQR